MPQPADTTGKDTLIVSDSIAVESESLAVGLIDTTEQPAKPVEELVFTPDTTLLAYYRSYLTGKGFGDFLWYRPGVIPLQHGAEGQPEMLVKSILLGGIDISHNGSPIFQQGYYIPFRTGADLNAFMFENVSRFELTPAYHIGLINQGQILALQSMDWPPPSNPSSITVAGGPYGYKRSGWRFSRQLNENMAADFVVGFKKSRGYYLSGADYNSFNVSGTFAARPKKNGELIYSFYDHKSKQGVVQFDRVFDPFLHLDRQINYHDLSYRHLLDKSRNIRLHLYYQENHNFVVDDGKTYRSRLKDYLSGFQAEYQTKRTKHNLSFSGGAGYQRLGGVGSDDSKMTTIAAMAGDSVKIDSLQDLIIRTRVRYNTRDNMQIAAAGALIRQLPDSNSIILAAGFCDYLPDLYSMYYHIKPLQRTGFGGTVIDFYTYRPDPDLKSKKSLFISGDYMSKYKNLINFTIGLTVERIYNDILQLTVDSSATWNTHPININYNRAALTGRFDYSLTKYFVGAGGITYFLYGPRQPLPELLPNTRHSPSFLAFSDGRLLVKNVLHDIDLAAAYQAHYVSGREYAGFVRTSYKGAVNLDASFVIRFGSVELKVIETNALDFLGGNVYDIWGEYNMPPGNVWWQFTWNFKN